MYTDINSITQQYFQKTDLSKVSQEEIVGFISRHPYSVAARYLLAQKLYNDSPQEHREELVTANLYINNQLWLGWLLNNYDHSVAQQTSQTIVEVKAEPMANQNEAGHLKDTGTAEHSQPRKETKDVTDDSPIVFQSYHTIDYFASQGIRLEAAELTKDRFGQQLKSFTEWLRSMKKLPMSEIEKPANLADDKGQQQVISSAAHSIEEKEVVTEAMAEVWAKQGNREKARDTYNKLSLLDPSKSAYFAAKIDQLK